VDDKAETKWKNNKILDDEYESEEDEELNEKERKKLLLSLQGKKKRKLERSELQEVSNPILIFLIL
jgi:hypothetical protein